MYGQVGHQSRRVLDLGTALGGPGINPRVPNVRVNKAVAIDIVSLMKTNTQNSNVPPAMAPATDRLVPLVKATTKNDQPRRMVEVRA